MNSRKRNKYVQNSISGTSTPDCQLSTSKSKESLWNHQLVHYAVGIFRTGCLICWIYCIIFATYSLYVAGREFSSEIDEYYYNGGAEEHLHDLIPVNFRDDTDEEWKAIFHILINLKYWYLVYIIGSYFLQKFHIQIRLGLSTLMTCSFCVYIMGWRSLIFMLQQPLIYCILMNTYRSRTLIWICSMISLWLLSFGDTLSFYLNENVGYQWNLADHCFQTLVAWNCARCLSFCFDNWNQSSISYLQLINYCFYFPLSFSGPLVLFSTFENDILKYQGRRGNFRRLLKHLIYLIFIFGLCELVIRFLHFQRLSKFADILYTVDLWVIGGIIFWLGQFFMLKYIVLYGIGTSIAEFEGLTMPPAPKCPSHIHRYSVLWRDFDRGLYDFLIRYTYIPTIELLNDTPVLKDMHTELKKFIASALTFLYVYIWHGLYRNVQIWALLNFIGITIERIGSLIKKQIDKQMKIHPMTWDFIVEPIVCIPLAGMSFLNSSVFLSSADAAYIFTERFWTSWTENFTVPVLFCITHVAVAIRTLPQFLATRRNSIQKK